MITYPICPMVLKNSWVDGVEREQYKIELNMTPNSTDIITKITVEIHKDDSSKEKLGTGIIYSNRKLAGVVYVLTAKHCLSGLAQKEKVSLRILNPNSGAYEYITPAKQSILLHSTDDAGIIVFNQRELVKIMPNIPLVYVVEKNVGFDEAVTKGFPIASLDQTSEKGESSLVTINMRYLQEVPAEQVFQLSTLDDYNEDTIKGMSGAGIFIEACEELYINGIFTRFSDEERGKVIYSQRLSSFNELLGKEYKKKMPIAFLGRCGLGYKTFKDNVDESVANLGPRYCEKVNVKTGTAKYFDCVAKTPEFYERLKKDIDAWLTEKSYRIRKDSSRIGDLEAHLKAIRSDFAVTLMGLSESVESIVDFSDLMKRIDVFQKEMEDIRHQLYSDFSSSNKDVQFRKELDADESRLIEISRDLYSFRRNYEDLKIGLANNPYFIIKGEAGCGKSHLMGDVASNRISDGLPTILLLGSDFADGSYESTIISRIGFAGTFKEFLYSFNQIGIQVGSRALLMIDALNEGNQATLWKERLPGLIKALKAYPAIGLVVSVRDTYFTDVIPDGIETESNVTIIEHKGFKGMEYEAVRQFCSAYELNLPNVPILTPEFCNPLFLKIVCDTLEASREKNFPKGFNGISSLFNQYFKNLDKKFAEKKPEYKYRDIVSTSVKLLAFPVFEAKYNLLKKQDADSILLQHFSACPTLLADLIDNNVLLKTKSSFSDDDMDRVVFTYQRISDYIIAREIVKKYPDWSSFGESVHSDKSLREIIVENHWSFKGILEAIAILIPEIFGHEVIDLIQFIPKAELKKNYSCLDYLSSALIDSLNWRSLESINKDSIREFLYSKYCRLNLEDWWFKLVELSTIPGHPFNADYFHAMMMGQTMPQRDGAFQFFFNSCARYDDYKRAYPFRRLIDWAWSENISVYADTESTRLATIMLCWLLSSTYIKHRDEATKALVNLLSEKVDVLIDTLRLFEGVDDMYIYERLYAVAYGVALRTSSRDGLTKLARYVYDTIFKHNTPPKDVLLRDYARNIVEYAKYRGGLTAVNMRKVRPPYSSILPEWPSDEEVEKYHIDYDAPDYKERKGMEQNQIWESVKGGLADFWNKLVEPSIEKFCPISIAEEKEYQQGLRLFKAKWRKLAIVYSEIKAREIINGKPVSWNNSFQGAMYKVLNEGIAEMLSEEQKKAINDILIPFKVKELPLIKNRYGHRFPTEGVRNWLVKRAYDLGYDVKLHGDYDRLALDWTFRNSDNRIDRVGKKYQWIAFHEIMGVLADNYKYENDYANNGFGGYELFHGTWQSYLRDINPSMIAKKEINDIESPDDNREMEDQKWYRDELFDNWEYPGTDDAWTSMTEDLPDPVTLIQKIDDIGTEWFALRNYRSWDEPKDIGKEKYEYKLKRHDVYMAAYAILVKQQDVRKAVETLAGKNLWELDQLPTDDWQYLVNREKYWSPAYKDEYRNRQGWSNSIKGLGVPCIYSCEYACGHIEGDHSGAIHRYSIPCRLLFEGIGMEYDSHDGQYVDNNGDLVAITHGDDQILVKKEPLIRFLEQQELAILWLIRGEKRAYVSGGIGCLSEGNPCGVFFLDSDNNLEGELKSYKRV